jgi:hypothetical protein
VSTLPIKVEKRIAGECLYSGCREQARDGSDYCDPHDAHERGRDAAKKRRRRQRLAGAGLCAGGCGRKVGKRRRTDGTIVQRRCSGCTKELKAEARKRRSVPGDRRSVPGNAADLGSASSPAGWKVTLEQSPDGIMRERSRYAGQGKKGRQSIEQLDDQDRADAIRCIDRGLEHLATHRSPAVQEMPRIQRDEYLAQALDQLRRAQGWLDEIIERHSAKSGKTEGRSEDAG